LYNMCKYTYFLIRAVVSKEAAHVCW
jgi:hypothetical protein